MDTQPELLFDALANEDSPSRMLGDILGDSSRLLAATNLSRNASDARSRVNEVFGKQVTPDGQGTRELDSIVSEMWSTGWDPKRKSLDLFASDFGALYASAFRSIDGLTLVARSTDDHIHLSFWSPIARMEYFPYHKVVKALQNPRGESLSQMYEGAVSHGRR